MRWNVISRDRNPRFLLKNLKLQSLELAVETLEDSQKNSDPSREILELRMQHEIIMADKAMELAKLQLRIAELGTKFGRPTHISATTTTTQKNYFALIIFGEIMSGKLQMNIIYRNNIFPHSLVN